MSLFGAMNAAISGLGAQSAAFSNISDNVANSQTVGYKRVDTSFIDYLTTSTATQNDSGAVAARPDYVNDVQGTVTQTDNALGLAIAGQGFFAVSQQNGEVNSLPTFSPQQYYTRAGDFKMDKNGYLVNSAGNFLNGWPVNIQTGIVNQNTLSPIQVTQTVYNPVATTTVTLSANLPATPAAGTAIPGSPVSSDIDVYDALGTLHTIALNWVKTAQDTWSVQVNSADDTALANRGTADVSFGPATSGNPVPSGTVGALQIDAANPGTITTSPYAANTAATVSFTTNFGSGPQTITINLGTYGQTNGVTQYAGTQYNLRGLTQDGVPPGAFASVSTQANGAIVVNYDNGQTRTIAQVPVITFNDPNKLDRQNGEAFTASNNSGTPLAEAPGSNGAGNLVTQSVESSNVDIATEFSKLIVAQQAYSANTKMVTTADQMLQQTINMKQ
ncbi:MAG TPA: flagellar hook protein FlgE [Acetobacteraceae bacterium]|jgi:flagellar hook protein FlgE|nr:flagellar hook protein FlgE [Acetobacteraceae bacterium]